MSKIFRVLIVDDDTQLEEELSRDLGAADAFFKEFVEFDQVDVPQEAFSRLSEADLILLDMDFGAESYKTKDGVEVPSEDGDTREVGKAVLIDIKKSIKELPVVMLTVTDDPYTISELRALGAEDYVVKKEAQNPMSPEQQAEIIKKVLFKTYDVKEVQIPLEIIESGDTVSDAIIRISTEYKVWEKNRILYHDEGEEITLKDYCKRIRRIKADEEAVRIVEETFGSLSEKHPSEKALKYTCDILQLGNEDMLLYVLPPSPAGRNRRWELDFWGRCPSYVKSPKYGSQLKKRLQIYGMSIASSINRIVSMGKEEQFEVLEMFLEFEGRDENNEIERILLDLERDAAYIVVPRFEPLSLFDIMGPIMIGPSSSHTAGANRLARIARNLAKAGLDMEIQIKSLKCQMHDSFRSTGMGHGSDKAIAAGLIGWKEDDDEKLPHSLDEIATSNKIEVNGTEIEWEDFEWGKDLEGKGDREYHSNSAKFIFKDEEDREVLSLIGESWGGGNVQIREIKLGEMDVYINPKEVGYSCFNGKKDVYLLWDKNAPEKIKSVLEHLKEKYQLLYLSESSENLFIVELEEPQKQNDFEKDLDASEITYGKIDTIYEPSKSEDLIAPKPDRPDFLTLEDLTLEDLPKLADQKLWEIALEYEKATQGVNEDYIKHKMQKIFETMMTSIEIGIPKLRRQAVEAYTPYEKAVAYDFNSKMRGRDDLQFAEIIAKAVAYSIAVNEVNAKMKGKIVAAPTAGSCGIVPGVLKALLESDILNLSEEQETEEAIRALFTSALIGLVINNVVPTSGAQYGCQAEAGTGAAMAAALAAQLLGGEPKQIIHAATLALKNSLGLVCDPIHGKVEVPCIKRAGMKAGEAIQAAVLALCDVESIVSPSEVVSAMREIGENMDKIYKETAKGGLAVTPTARRLLR